MLNLKRWAIGGLAGVMALLVLAGCGTASGSSAGSVPAPTGPATSAATPGAPAPPPGLLVTPADLRALLGSPTLRIVDMGSGDEYAAGHIPGAVHIDWSELQVTDTSAPSIAAWQTAVAALLGRRGIGAGDRVVIYDHGTLYGARLWWVLDQLGHADKQILDGGYPAWQTTGGAASQDPSTYPATTYAAQPQPAVLAPEAQVRLALGQGGIRLVDARSPGEYTGQAPSGAAHDGHIPGAVNVPYNTTAGGGTPAQYQSPAALRALFAAQDVTPDQQVITYCSTGVRGAVDYFALRLAGFPRVRLYPGSWAEWGNDPAAPAAK